MEGTRVRGHHLEVESAECACRGQCCSVCAAKSHQGVMSRRCRPLEGMLLPREVPYIERADPLSGMLCVAWNSLGYMLWSCHIYCETHYIYSCTRAAQTLQECTRTHELTTLRIESVGQCTVHNEDEQTNEECPEKTEVVISKHNNDGAHE